MFAVFVKERQLFEGYVLLVHTLRVYNKKKMVLDKVLYRGYKKSQKVLTGKYKE